MIEFRKTHVNYYQGREVHRYLSTYNPQGQRTSWSVTHLLFNKTERFIYVYDDAGREIENRHETGNEKWPVQIRKLKYGGSGKLIGQWEILIDEQGEEHIREEYVFDEATRTGYRNLNGTLAERLYETHYDDGKTLYVCERFRDGKMHRRESSLRGSNYGDFFEVETIDYEYDEPRIEKTVWHHDRHRNVVKIESFLNGQPETTQEYKIAYYDE